MNNLYSFNWYCGRMGELTGLFIATQAEVDAAIGKELYFGEVLGKHSEIYGTLDAPEISLVSAERDKVDWLEEILGTTVSGFNPLHYVVERCDYCGHKLYDEEECMCQDDQA